MIQQNGLVREVRLPNLALILLAGTSLAGLTPEAARAADPSTSGTTTRVQEVIVTANRSSAESIQKLAMAVSAVSATQLDRTN